MCEPTTIFMVGTAIAGGMQAYGQYKEGSATNKYYKGVANAQEEQGRIEFARGEKQAELGQDAAKFSGMNQKTQAAQVASAQRASMVANGIDLGSVTASDLASETMDKSRLDELAIRYNADISTWNTMEDAKYKKWSAYTQASQSRATGKNALSAGKTAAFTTLLSTAASMAGGMMLAGSGCGAGTMAQAGKAGYGAGTPAGVFNTGKQSLFMFKPV